MNSTKRRKHKVIKKAFEHLWYIVDLYDIRNPRILPTHFADRSSARVTIRRSLKNNTIRFDVISGKRALKNKLKFVEHDPKKKKARTDGNPVGGIRIRKYNYPEEYDAIQQHRKTFRTIMRRRKKKGQFNKRHQNTINSIKPKEL